MRKNFLALIAAVVLLIGAAGCTNDDNPSTTDISALEQEIVGLWWDEYEYADVTETGEPFSRALLAVNVNADHSGCLYLGVFNDTSDEPLAVYGGPAEAGFTWRMLADGTVVLSDPATGEDIALTRTRSGGAEGSYGSGMTDVASTSVTYADGSVKVTNDNYSGTLSKADAGEQADIEKKLSTPPAATGHALSESAVGEIVGSDGKAYAVADKGNLPTGVYIVAVVAYVNDGHGLALALRDAGYGNWGDVAMNAAKNATPKFDDAEWRLPSLQDWWNIIGQACGVNKSGWTYYESPWYGIAALSGYIIAAGGVNLGKNGFYWSSTEQDGGNAWQLYSHYNGRYYRDNMMGRFCYGFKGDNHNIRLCLAF